VVVIVDGASLGIMSFAFGVFDAADYYGVLPDLGVRVVSGEPDAAIRGGGLVYEVPYDLSAIREAELVIVPYWRDPAEHPPEPLLEALRGAHDGGARVAGLCSGVFVLAAAGLLDERPATTHWALAEVLAQMYPKICVRASVLYIDDGDILTAGGGAAGMDLGLHLIRTTHGADVANRLARSMVVAPHRPGGQSAHRRMPTIWRRSLMPQSSVGERPGHSGLQLPLVQQEPVGPSAGSAVGHDVGADGLAEVVAAGGHGQ
jgi:transcriptional regulator GlxA family with amidase domain